jgi:uncharacterized protein
MKDEAKKAGKKATFSIVTNGTLLDEDIILFLQEHNFMVQISIDGPPDMHDTFRVDTEGRGSYDQTIKYLPALLEKLGTEKVEVRGTITHLNSDVLEAFEHLRGLGFQQPELRPVTGHESDYGMTVSDYLHFNKEVSELARRLLKSKPGEARQYITLFNPYMNLLFSRSTRRAPCGASRNMLGISIDGSILPCTDLVGEEHEALNFGDVYKGLNRNKKEQFLEIVDVETKAGCSSCWARYVCGGACASVELKNEGGLEQNAGLECIWIRHAIETSLWLYANMLAHRPDLFYELYGKEFLNNYGPLAEIFSAG